MNKYFLTALLWLAFGIAAQNARAEIQFPIPELGNCADKAACKAFCDTTANFQACTEFAEKNNLLPQESIQRSKKFVELIKRGGPGNCRTERTCRTYCEDASHIKECVRFAKESGIVAAKEVERLEKIVTLKEADLPGDCTSIKTCRTYCANPDNREECLAFAESAGYFPREEVQRAKQLFLRDSTNIRDTQPAISPMRPRFSIAVMKCIEQIAGKTAAERISAGALQLDPKLEIAVKQCVARAESLKPSVTPMRPTPAEDVPVISIVPPELLNGGATNLPVPEARLHQSIKRYFYLGSLLRALMSF